MPAAAPTTDEERPHLSVVIASYNAAATIERCLRSLEQQEATVPFEVVVVDSSTDGTADLVARRFPRVRLLRERRRRFPGDARNVGVAHVRADVIAFTDADCFVAPTWVARVLEAHARWPDPVIGGAVENGNPDSTVGWAYYLFEFNRWLPCGAARVLPDIPTTCLTVKRWLLDEVGPFVEGTYSSDTVFNWRAAALGHRPLFVPDIRVSHVNPTGVRELLRRKTFHGRCFARLRCVEQRWPAWRRLVHAAGSPLLPGLLMARMLRAVRGTPERRHFVRVSPLLLCAAIAWSAGELIGCCVPRVAPVTETDA